MNRWTGVNLTLAMIVAALLALHLWPRNVTGMDPLTDLERDRVSLVRVERTERLQLELQRDERGWRLTHPREAAAKQNRVGQLLAIARAPVQQRFPADAGLAPYGLDKPKAVLQLNQLRLQFGDRDPGRDSRYVLVDGEVRVIDDVFFNLLSLPGSHFITD